MAVTKDWKYIYSAPDSHEFLFDRQSDPRETRNVAENPFLHEIRQQMKTLLVDYVKQDQPSCAIENNEFRPFRLPPFVRDPDAGHLIQDGYTPWSSASIPGYTDV
jgi:hypothetical protein